MDVGVFLFGLILLLFQVSGERKIEGERGTHTYRERERDRERERQRERESLQ